MKPLTLFLAAILLLTSGAALAMRCNGKLVREGDPRPKVLSICGEPTSVIQNTVYRAGIPAPGVGRRIETAEGTTRLSVTNEELLIHDRSVVEVLVEEWTYNFGPHRLMHVIRFENGVVAEVTRLGYGYTE